VPPSALGVTIYTQVATYDGVLRASTVAVTSVLF
jgi:hypothetical protein